MLAEMQRLEHSNIFLSCWVFLPLSFWQGHLVVKAGNGILALNVQNGLMVLSNHRDEYICVYIYTYTHTEL